MSIKEEKQIPNAVAFEIELDSKPLNEDPQIKKKLEAAAEASVTITFEQIQEKLQRAEEKRKQNMKGDVFIERKSRANERKLSLEQEKQLETQNKIAKVERDRSNAEMKRSTVMDGKLKKLADHNSKVLEVKTKVTSEEEKRIQAQRERLTQRLNAAQQKRELRLQQIKEVAHLSAIKKLHLVMDN
jgi:hypothetical protein